MMRPLVLVSMAMLATACPGRAEAGLIQFKEQATLGGSLAGVGFAPTTVTFTILADGSNVAVTGGGSFDSLPVISATVAIGAASPVAITDGLSVFLYRGDPGDPGGYFQFQDNTQGIEILTAYAPGPGFSSTSLATPFVAISGSTAYANTAPSFGTSAGGLQLTSSSGLTTVSSSALVPEPSSLVLAGLGGLGYLAFARRRASGGRRAAGR